MIDDPAARILDFAGCLAWRDHARAGGKKVVLTNGCFNILHRGHLEYLRQSATLGDLLVVAINSDHSVRMLKGADRPLHHELDRAYALASLRCVDAVFVFPGPRLDHEIRALAPDFYTKAGDYTPDTLDRSEFAALSEVAAAIRIIPFVPGHSTTSAIARLDR